MTIRISGWRLEVRDDGGVDGVPGYSGEVDLGNRGAELYCIVIATIELFK